MVATLSCVRLATEVEVIVVDGGSQDRTVELAASCGTQVLFSPPGRAQQMNTGAAAATGDVLLFLHADTCLPSGFDRQIRRALSQPGVVASAFTLRIDAPAKGLRVIEFGVNCRSRYLQMPYGDQAIAVRAGVFREIGGFPNLPIMEDFELVRRLRRLGRIVLIPSPILTSARRWQTLGMMKTTLFNQFLIAAYFLGFSPTRLARWYYQKSKFCSGSFELRSRRIW